MKDLSYLQAFSIKSIRSTRRILQAGFTIEDLDKYLEEPLSTAIEEESLRLNTRLERPCCDDEIDKQLQAFKGKQRKRKALEV